MKWKRADTGCYISGDYELLPVGFRRRRAGYVVQCKGVHVDSCSTLVRAKARAERHAASLGTRSLRAEPSSQPIAPADRLAVYLEVAAKLRATGEHGSEVAALLVEQLADELTLAGADPG